MSFCGDNYATGPYAKDVEFCFHVDRNTRELIKDVTETLRSAITNLANKPLNSQTSAVNDTATRTDSKMMNVAFVRGTNTIHQQQIVRTFCTNNNLRIDMTIKDDSSPFDLNSASLQQVLTLAFQGKISKLIV